MKAIYCGIYCSRYFSGNGRKYNNISNGNKDDNVCAKTHPDVQKWFVLFFFVIFVSILLIVVYLATRITSKLLNLIRPWAQNYVRTVLNREMLFADDHLRQTWFQKPISQVQPFWAFNIKKNKRRDRMFLHHPSVSIDDVAFKATNHFTYLGSTIAWYGKWQKHCSNSISAGQIEQENMEQQPADLAHQTEAIAGMCH